MNTLAIEKEKILELLRKAFDEGYSGYSEMREPVTERILEEFIRKNRPVTPPVVPNTRLVQWNQSYTSGSISGDVPFQYGGIYNTGMPTSEIDHLSNVTHTSEYIPAGGNYINGNNLYVGDNSNGFFYAIDPGTGDRIQVNSEGDVFIDIDGPNQN